MNKPHHNSLIANRSDPGSENKLDIIQSLVPTHYVYNGYLFLQSESLDVDCSGFGFKVYNATFNNISVISLRAVLLVKETGVLYSLLSQYHAPPSTLIDNHCALSMYDVIYM